MITLDNLAVIIIAGWFIFMTFRIINFYCIAFLGFDLRKMRKLQDQPDPVAEVQAIINDGQQKEKN